MRVAGHDVIHVPLYLPHFIDGEDDSKTTPIFFGGVNVYLQERIPLLRHSPSWLDRPLDARWLLRAVSHRTGSTSPHDLGALTHSMLRGEMGHQRKELDRLINWLEKPEHRPDVVTLSNLLLIGMARELKQRLGVRVICSLQGEESFLQDLPERWRKVCWDETRARLGDVDHFVSPSQWFADVMRGHLGGGLAPMTVIPNGIHPAEFKLSKQENRPPTIGYLARLCHLKGLPSLVRAFLTLGKMPEFAGWHLHLAGTITGDDRELMHALQKEIAAAGLTGRVEWSPDLAGEKKADFLAGCNLFSVPALYGEAFGLYLLEAWAAGVPVVQPHHAAFPELIEASGGGWLYPPEDADGLTNALAAAMRDGEGRKTRGANGRKQTETTWHIDRMAAQFLQCCAA